MGQGVVGRGGVMVLAMGLGGGYGLSYEAGGLLWVWEVSYGVSYGAGGGYGVSYGAAG